MKRVLLTMALSLSLASTATAAVPVWGAKQSSAADVPPSQLKPGEWIWGGRDASPGPMAVIVSLTEQRAYAYRNGILIGVSTVSTGKKGYETPTGVFTILQKDKDHHSKKYDNAPMPYQERLTWDGVALHAGGLPGYPESHGCVHLPTEFARLLFESTNMGMTVVVAKEGTAPVTVVHPSAVIPIDPRNGADLDLPPLAEGEPYRWNPDASPTGPISMVLSVPDGRVVVFRNGIEIGRSRVEVNDPLTGTHAFIVGQGYMADTPNRAGLRMPNWITIGIPGHGDEAGKVVDDALADRVAVPREFMEKLLPLLTPGSVLLATDESMSPASTGGKVEVIDSNPPGV
ncbi:L,D-transpeptidase [Luteibacter sp. 9133]|uniref:L,D-transpeptidase n=1 Tax=Luteibacter sp. 9133 TaxID=1500891 RepID=UPI000A7892AA|nr:L,D-transpeptidase [Luteibacter sp. 9133]